MHGQHLEKLGAWHRTIDTGISGHDRLTMLTMALYWSATVHMAYREGISAYGIQKCIPVCSKGVA